MFARMPYPNSLVGRPELSKYWPENSDEVRQTEGRTAS